MEYTTLGTRMVVVVCSVAWFLCSYEHFDKNFSSPYIRVGNYSDVGDAAYAEFAHLTCGTRLLATSPCVLSQLLSQPVPPRYIANRQLVVAFTTPSCKKHAC